MTDITAARLADIALTIATLALVGAIIAAFIRR
jgi:hypothetical protein